MSEFSKKFLMEDGRRLNPGTGRQIFLGAFGKHPGWDDHVEDLGLESDSLIFAKTLLYVNGIGGQIDAGAWEKLDSAQQIPAFKHVFVWQRGGQSLIGRMWSSSDGKGRTRYPMVICAHCVGVPLPWAMDQVLPRLERIELACLQTKSAADVRAILDRFRNELRGALNDVIPETEQAPVSTEARTRFLVRPEFEPQQEGLFRILYQLKNVTPAFASGKSGTKTDTSIRPQQIRLPQSADSLSQSVLLWTRFFHLQIDQGTPLLFTIPLEDPWLDATMGEPGTQELFCLRASPKSVPLANEIPYNLDPSFREKCAKFLSAFQNNAQAPVNLSDAPPPTAPTGLSGATQRWFKSLTKWGAVFLVLGLVFWLVILPRMKGNPKASPETPAAGAGGGGGPQLAQTTQTAVKSTAQVETPVAVTSNAAITAAQNADAKRLADEQAALQAAQAKSAADAEARLEEEKAKQVAAASRLAEESKAKQLAEEKRLADEKAKADLAASAASNVTVAAVVPAKVITTPDASTTKDNVTAAVDAQPKPSGRRELTNGIGMELLWIEKMPGTRDGAFVGKYEVTQAQYLKVMGSNPSIFSGDTKRPVENVSWNDAVDFCRKLTALEAKSLSAGQVYMLPTPPQWEFFLADARFEDSITSRGTAQKSSAPVGSTRVCNKFGLYDVLGNVWEWCQDDSNAAEKTLKGGAYNTLKTFSFKPMTETTPMKRPPDAKSDEMGFRCVLVSMP